MSPFAMLLETLPRRHVPELARLNVIASPFEPVGVVHAHAVPMPVPLVGANSKKGVEVPEVSGLT